MKNNFLKSLTVLASGSLFAQLITILVSPISTRLFSPENFGSYTLVTTAVSIFGPIICLKYDMSIVSAKSINEQTSLITGSFFITIFFSTIISILYGCLILKDNLSIGIYISMVVLLISYGINNILLSLNNSRAEYSLISKVTVTKSIVQAVLTIFTGLLNLGYLGLIISQVSSQFAGVLKQSESLRKDKSIFKNVTKINIITSLRENYRQPIFNSSAALLTTFTYSSINIFIGAFYSNEMLGFYSLSYRMLGLPFMIVSANIAKLFFKEAKEEFSVTNNFSGTFSKTMKILIILVLPSMILLYIVAPAVFKIVFGSNWIISGEIVQIMVPMFTLRLIVDSLTTTYIIREKQAVELIIQALLLVSEIVVYFIAVHFCIQINQFLQLINLVYSFVYLINFLIIFRLSKGENKK